MKDSLNHLSSLAFQTRPLTGWLAIVLLWALPAQAKDDVIQGVNPRIHAQDNHTQVMFDILSPEIDKIIGQLETYPEMPLSFEVIQDHEVKLGQIDHISLRGQSPNHYGLYGILMEPLRSSPQEVRVRIYQPEG